MIKAMTIHPNGSITAHQGISGATGRRLGEQADEHAGVIEELRAAVATQQVMLEKQRAMMEKQQVYIDKLSAAVEKLSGLRVE